MWHILNDEIHDTLSYREFVHAFAQLEERGVPFRISCNNCAPRKHLGFSAVRGPDSQK